MLKKLFSAFFDRRFLRFCIVGVANTLFGTAVMYAVRNLVPWTAIGFSAVSHWPYWISSAANYVLGSILSYFLNKYFTFRAAGGGAREVLRFAANITVCYLIAYGAAKPLVKLVLSGASVTVRDNVAMLVGMVLFTGLNYLGQRFFAFRQPENSKNADNNEKNT